MRFIQHYYLCTETLNTLWYYRKILSIFYEVFVISEELIIEDFKQAVFVIIREELVIEDSKQAVFVFSEELVIEDQEEAVFVFIMKKYIFLGFSLGDLGY